jgi:hypothetical protein
MQLSEWHDRSSDAATFLSGGRQYPFCTGNDENSFRHRPQDVGSGQHPRDQPSCGRGTSKSWTIRVESASKEVTRGGVAYREKPTHEDLQVIAEILQKSAALSLHERKLAEKFDRVEHLA